MNTATLLSSLDGRWIGTVAASGRTDALTRYSAATQSLTFLIPRMRTQIRYLFRTSYTAGDVQLFLYSVNGAITTLYRG